MIKKLQAVFIFILLLSFAILPATLPAKASAAVYPPTSGTQHYFYNFTDGTMYVYDIDNNFNLVYSTAQPTSTGIRGMVASPTDGMLYIAFGGAGGTYGNGGLLKYNLLTNAVVWQKNYNFGIDSPGITPDGKKIYLADGEFSGSNLWYVIDTNTGNVITSIAAGTGPHNTIVSLDGTRVYMGARYTSSDYIADTSTDTVVGTIGPLKSGGRPFTINGTQTYAFTTAENYLGFQVSNIQTGQVIYTVPVSGFTNNGSMLIPDHGISLSPDEKEIYLIDGVNDYVHVFDVSGLPNTAPTQVANIHLTKPIAGQSESACAYDCGKEGWMLHSTSGRYVFVGDAGDVIDTTTRTVATNISTLQNSRKYLEIDWQDGHPSFTTNRYGLGYVTTPTPTPSTSVTPTPTPTATPTPTPNPSGILGQDNFTRANQTEWGIASDGQSWTSDASNITAFSIANNSGKITNTGTNSYNAILGTPANDEQVLFTGSLSTFSSANIGALVRWTDTNNWYKAYIDGTNLVLQKKVNGTSTTLKTTAFSATVNTNYSLRFQVVGNTLSARVWVTGQTEPSNWTATATDSTFSSGYAGLRMLTNNGTATYTSFLVTDLSVTPTPTPTPTNTPTPTPTDSITPTPTDSITPTVTPTPTNTPTPTPTSTPTPTPVSNVIAQDTFHRANQTFWGTASDGQIWGADAATNNIFSINSNTAKVTGGSTTYTGTLGPTATNAQILFSGFLSNFTNNNLGGVLRFTDSNNWYKAYIDGNSLIIQKKVNGTATTLKTVSFAATTGTNYTLRFQVVGTTLSAKVWATAGIEPTNWTTTATDSSLNAGFCGLRMQALSATATYTSFLATSL